MIRFNVRPLRVNLVVFTVGRSFPVYLHKQTIQTWSSGSSDAMKTPIIGRTCDGQVTDLPDGLFGDLPVQPHLQKYFRSRLTQITSISLAVPFRQEGRIARRHERGTGCGGRESVRRAMAIAGRDEPRERSASARDDRRFSGRQSRVVPTPVAGAKLAEAKSSSTGFDEPLIRQ